MYQCYAFPVGKGSVFSRCSGTLSPGSQWRLRFVVTPDEQLWVSCLVPSTLVASWIRQLPMRVNLRLRSMRRRLVPEGRDESSPVRSAGMAFKKRSVPDGTIDGYLRC